MSTVHDEKILNLYLIELDKIFQTINKCEDGLDIFSLLDNNICASEFKDLIEKNFLVRVDYSSLNGLGHIIRQINFLKKLDKNFFYVLSNKSNINISFILNRNTSLIKISTIKNKKIQFEKDAKITLKILKKYKCDYLIVDNLYYHRNGII